MLNAEYKRHDDFKLSQQCAVSGQMCSSFLDHSTSDFDPPHLSCPHFVHSVKPALHQVHLLDGEPQLSGHWKLFETHLFFIMNPAFDKANTQL